MILCDYAHLSTFEFVAVHDKNFEVCIQGCVM